tara:strand:+ start:20 stop:289 length:270 start_codon:yes stop_codon:yes gene_type:complete
MDHGFNEEFLRSLLLTLEQNNFEEYMNLTYYVIMQSPSVILKRNLPLESKIESIDKLIKYFEGTEEYERCTNLQKLKTFLYINNPEEDV